HVAVQSRPAFALIGPEVDPGAEQRDERKASERSDGVRPIRLTLLGALLGRTVNALLGWCQFGRKTIELAFDLPQFGIPVDLGHATPREVGRCGKRSPAAAPTRRLAREASNAKEPRRGHRQHPE